MACQNCDMARLRRIFENKYKRMEKMKEAEAAAKSAQVEEAQVEETQEIEVPKKEYEPPVIEIVDKESVRADLDADGGDIMIAEDIVAPVNEQKKPKSNSSRKKKKSNSKK